MHYTSKYVPYEYGVYEYVPYCEYITLNIQMSDQQVGAPRPIAIATISCQGFQHPWFFFKVHV